MTTPAAPGLFPASSFVTTDVVVRPVKMLDGSDVDVSIRMLPHSDWEVFRLQSRDPSDEKAALATSVLIAKSIIDPSTGKLALELEQARRLHDKVAKALVAAILSVNGFGRDAEAAVEKKAT